MTSQNYRLKIFIVFFAGFYFLQPVLCQVQTARFTSMISNSNGYYEYLPEGYNSGNQTYPLMVFLHGYGEIGNGSSQLPLVLINGVPKIINDGLFPNSFTVNSQTHRFIVISPQFVDWPTPSDIDNIINYLIQHYRVNTNRIYLTGISMGGGVTWDYPGVNSQYAHRLAAIVPVCGASDPNYSKARTIANANLPVWATHNDRDPTVPVSNTNGYIAFINEPPAPVPPAQKTIFSSDEHDAWTKTYDPNFRENGLNVYEWMLQFQLNINIPLPVTLSSYKVTRTGDSQITITWSTLSELNNDHFTLERSADGIDFIWIANIPSKNSNSSTVYSYADNAPLDRNNFYRLSQTDKDGRVTYYSVLKINLAPNNHNVFSINPNPVKNNATIELFHQERGNILVILSDMNGKKLRIWKFQKQEYEWRQLLNIQYIKPGTYFLRTTAGKMNESIIFVKE